MRLAPSIVCLLSIAAPSAVAADGVPRFVALLADGSRVEGDALAQWHTAATTPELDGRPLLARENPFRWLLDRQRSPGPTPTAFLETTTGDRLPGTVKAFRNGDEQPFANLPAHFVVEPATLLRPPGRLDRGPVRIRADFARRVVWQSRKRNTFRPGTLFYRDGRAVAYRAARFEPTAVRLLTEDGQRRAEFSEIAELHLPQADAWQPFFDELSILAARPDTRLLQLETRRGLIVTAPLERFRAYPRGKPDDFSRWTHGLHPAWSLDMLWTGHDEIWARRLFTASKPPLSRLPPIRSQQRTFHGQAGRAWRRDRNVRQGALRSDGLDYGWGFGVHAFSELCFALPRFVTAFRCRAGLDQAARGGGCIQARIYGEETTGDALFVSPLLWGSTRSVDTGWLKLTAEHEPPSELVLQMDAAHEIRPPGADPYDIRDAADWLDPQLRLDPAELERATAGRQAGLPPSWEGWSLLRSPSDPLHWSSHWDDRASPWGAYRRGVATSGNPLALQRQMRVGPEDRWIVLALRPLPLSSAPPRVQILIDGRVVCDQNVPQQPGGALAPLFAPLPRPQSPNPRIMEFEIRQHPSQGASSLQWQAIELVEQLPTLFQALEDEGRLLDQRRSPPAEARDAAPALHAADRYSGRVSLKLEPGQIVRLTPPSAIPVREAPLWGEYRYLRFAFRKGEGGRVCLELAHADSNRRPARYDAGMGEPCGGAALRVWRKNLPDEWIVMTRDVFKDFGERDVTSLTLCAPDGGRVLFDHIYLARSTSDFELADRISRMHQSDKRFNSPDSGVR